MKTVLTSPSSFGQVGIEPVQILIDNGFHVINNPYGRKLTEDEVISLGVGCIGIVAGVEPLTARVMDSIPTLKCISRVGIGMDNVDLAYAQQKGIAVFNTPDGPTRSVAELTLALTLSLLRRIPQADSEMKKKNWVKQNGNLLYKKRVGVIGLGRIGKMVSCFFSTVGCVVSACDIQPDADWAAKNNVRLTSFTDIIADSDILTIHIPNDPSKKFLLDSEEFAKMRDGVFLINVSRGGVVNEEALIKNILSGKLAGAAIDVFGSEPYDGPLCNLDNVVLTPHIGSYAQESKLQMEIDAVQNLLNYF
jgi:D-3-phosphoglycerate dehydrogenase